VFGVWCLVFGVQGASGEAFNQSTKHQTLKTKHLLSANKKRPAAQGRG
jgi:hypothetical protein